MEDREGLGVQYLRGHSSLYQHCPSSSKGYLSIPRYPEIALCYHPVLTFPQLLLLPPPSDQHIA